MHAVWCRVVVARLCSVSFAVLIFVIVVPSSAPFVVACRVSMFLSFLSQTRLSHAPALFLIGRSPSSLLLCSSHGRPPTLAAMTKRKANRRDADSPCIAGHRGAAAMALANGGTASAARQGMARERRGG